MFVRDSGLLHQLLGIHSLDSLLLHPKLGASWEGFVLEQIIMTQPHDQAYYWATHQGAEIDLVLQRGDKLYGIECKRKDAPRITPSIRTALEDLKLSKVIIVYPGEKRFSLSDTTEVVPVSAIDRHELLFPEN